MLNLWLNSKLRMVKNETWLKNLQRINISMMVILTLLILSTFFIAFEESWRYLPVFKFQISDNDKLIEIFVHAHLFNFNLGFYFQLFVLIFSFMIFISTKRNISFHMIYILIILRSGLILMQNTTLPENYISRNGDSSVVIAQITYLILFSSIFILNLIFDTKKRPRNSEPSDTNKN